MGEDDVQRELGSLEARVVALEKTIGVIGQDVKAIRSRTDRASGIAMLIWICVPAALGAVLTWFVTK